jgi:hypothetical protein
MGEPRATFEGDQQMSTVHMKMHLLKVHLEILPASLNGFGHWLQAKH